MHCPHRKTGSSEVVVSENHLVLLLLQPPPTYEESIRQSMVLPYNILSSGLDISPRQSVYTGPEPGINVTRPPGSSVLPVWRCLEPQSLHRCEGNHYKASEPTMTESITRAASDTSRLTSCWRSWTHLNVKKQRHEHYLRWLVHLETDTEVKYTKKGTRELTVYFLCQWTAVFLSLLFFIVLIIILLR